MFPSSTYTERKLEHMRIIAKKERKHHLVCVCGVGGVYVNNKERREKKLKHLLTFPISHIKMNIEFLLKLWEERKFQWRKMRKASARKLIFWRKAQKLLMKLLILLLLHSNSKINFWLRRKKKIWKRSKKVVEEEEEVN